MVGMVTGEEIESGWASVNPIQYAVQEMDEGTSADAITAQMIHINYQKAQNMGRLINVKCFFFYLLRILTGEQLENRLMFARKQWEKYSSELQVLEDTLKTLDPSIVPRYREHYTSHGGEQFRPDSSKFLCKSG